MVALRRYLAMDGKMGACPDWYTDVQIAKYLNIPIPEIINVPLWWRDKAIIAMNAEAQAADIKEQRNRR